MKKKKKKHEKKNIYKLWGITDVLCKCFNQSVWPNLTVC